MAQAHPQLDPLLEQNRPSWMEDIKLTKCALITHLDWNASLQSVHCTFQMQSGAAYLE